MRAAAFLLFVVLPLLAKEPIRYTVRIPQPDSHYVEVAMDAPSEGRSAIDVKMAIWTQYVIREYARNVEDLRGPGAVTKIAKNRWRAETRGAQRVTLRYRVYCRSLHVQDCFVDDEFALINGAPVFLTLGDHDRPHEVRFEMPAGWKTSVTQMERRAGHSYAAPDYDALVDSPVILGNPAIHTEKAAGKRIHLVNTGDGSQWDAARSARDLARIAEAQARIWGGLPCEDYYFLNILGRRGGGMEHRCSTVTMAERDTMQNGRRYHDWLDLMSHEMFHLWNVKRLRPAEIVPGEFEAEPYPRTLGIAEGFTSYYGPLAVYRSGAGTREQWLTDLSRLIHTLETTPGRKAQSLAMSSFDTWIKFYRPDENSANTAISYYTKGAVVAFLLDARVRKLTGGRRKLDDVMRTALARNPVEKGYTLDSFRAAAEEVAGADLRAWFRKHFESTEELDYQEALGWFGLRFEMQGGEGPWLGADVEPRGTGLAVVSVDRDSPAARGGLSVDDEIRAWNGAPVKPGEWAQRMASQKAGDRVTLTVVRRGREIARTVEFGNEPSVPLRLETDPAAGNDALKRLSEW